MQFLAHHVLSLQQELPCCVCNKIRGIKKLKWYDMLCNLEFICNRNNIVGNRKNSFKDEWEGVQSPNLLDTNVILQFWEKWKLTKLEFWSNWIILLTLIVLSPIRKWPFKHTLRKKTQTLSQKQDKGHV